MAGLTARPEPAVEVGEEARSLAVELDLTAARPAISRALDRLLDALADQTTAEQMAMTVTPVQRAKRLELGFGRWRTQHRVVAPWRAHPASRERLRPLGDGLDVALVATSAR